MKTLVVALLSGVVLASVGCGGEGGGGSSAPPDSDGDTVPDDRDNCPLVSNRDQEDADLDGVGDVCDNCPDLANPDQVDDGSCELAGLFTFIGRNAQGYDEYAHDLTGIVFVLLPGGTFNMGSPDDGTECWRSGNSDGSFDPESPVHEVTLSPFLIAKYEVTQADWTAVMGGNPSWFDGLQDAQGNPADPPYDHDNLPVEQVSWNDVQLFEARTDLMLPTEAQWEYACRAGSETAFWFGDQLSTDQANFFVTTGLDPCRAGSGDFPARPVDVGSYPPNGFGLHDMHGNVSEWCEDIWDEDFYSHPSAAGPDPVSIVGTSDRVYRGGSWGHSAKLARSAYRIEGAGLPSDSLRVRGFRPAVSLP